LSLIGAQLCGDHYAAVVSKGNETSVQRKVEIWKEQQAVKEVGAFTVGRQLPGLEMGCPEKSGRTAARDGATAPVVQQVLPKAALTEPDIYKRLALGFGQVRRLWYVTELAVLVSAEGRLLKNPVIPLTNAPKNALSV